MTNVTLFSTCFATLPSTNGAGVVQPFTTCTPMTGRKKRDAAAIVDEPIAIINDEIIDFTQLIKPSKSGADVDMATVNNNAYHRDPRFVTYVSKATTQLVFTQVSTITATGTSVIITFFSCTPVGITNTYSSCANNG